LAKNKGKTQSKSHIPKPKRKEKDQGDADRQAEKGAGGFPQQYVNMLFVLGIVKISTGPRTLHIIFNTQYGIQGYLAGQSWPISRLAYKKRTKLVVLDFSFFLARGFLNDPKQQYWDSI